MFLCESLGALDIREVGSDGGRVPYAPGRGGVYAVKLLDRFTGVLQVDGYAGYNALANPIAIGVDWDGRRQVLAVDLANRKSASGWKEFLQALKDRGLKGVGFIVSDDHPGLKKAIAEVLLVASR